MESYYIPLLCVCAFILIMPELSRHKNGVRICVISLLIMLGIRYMIWRTVYTIPSVEEHGSVPYWMWICYVQEMLVWIDSMVFFLLLSLIKNRVPDALKHEQRLRLLSSEDHPFVDIYFTIYNEPLEILEHSVIGATKIDWPVDRMKIWVLDDGQRREIKDFCEKVGVGYIARLEHTGAKAGNINHALSQTKGEFIAIFDTDFIPHRHFLYRTMGFFEDPAIAIVQTPHGFYNPDFVQSNLKLFESIPHDQTLFFDSIMPSRDAWGVAFFCGTSAVLRRGMLLEVGGIPTKTVTEDVLLSLVLLRKGYKTIYLNQRLSHGLVPESIKDFTVQRRRWCLGNLQMLFLKEGIFGKGLTFKERLFFFPFYWLYMIVIRWITFVAPLGYLWFNISMLNATLPDLIFYQVPFILAVFAVMIWIAPWQFIPIVTNAFDTIQAISVIPVGLQMLFRPFKTEFHITPKKNVENQKYANVIVIFVCALLFLLSFFGLIINLLPQYQVVPYNGFFPIAVFWTIVNTLTLGLAVMLCFEGKRHRQYERFPVHEKIELTFNGHRVSVEVIDISVSGIRVRLPEGMNLEGQLMKLHISDVGDIESLIMFQKDDVLGLEFIIDKEETRHKLIAFILTGRFDNTKADRKIGRFTKKILSRSLGHHH